jgi:two-component system, OmpR family, response regulator
MQLSSGADFHPPPRIGAPQLTRILVVDDLKDVTETMGLLFETLGHDIRVAADGQQAVDTALAFEPEIVFMDLDMPVLNGYEAARAIRAAALAHQPFLVALTASHGVAVEVATRAVGFDFYLRKPADTNALLALVADLSTRTRPSP